MYIIIIYHIMRESVLTTHVSPEVLLARRRTRFYNNNNNSYNDGITTEDSELKSPPEVCHTLACGFRVAYGGFKCK